MKKNTKTLLTIGGLAIGGYLLYKMFFGGGQQLLGGGGTGGSGSGCSGDYCSGWLPGDQTPQTPCNADQNTPTCAPIPSPGNPTPSPPSPITGWKNNVVLPEVIYEVPGVALLPNLSISKNVQGDFFTTGGVGIIGGGYRAPTNQLAAAQQAAQTGAAVYLKQTTAVSVPTTGKVAAALTTGTPAQQVVQSAIAPKIISINGVSRKVM